MFTTTDQFGSCPYDGFYLYADELPKTTFIHRVRGKIRSVHQNPQARRTLGYHRSAGRPAWRHFVSLTIKGVRGALKLMWDPIGQFPGGPMTRIYFNPATTGYDVQQTFNLLATVLDHPRRAQLASLDTKVDVVGTYWRIAAHIYMPYVRFTENWEFPGTLYEGKRTKMAVYQKSGHLDVFRAETEVPNSPEPFTTRVELRQRFRKPRHTLVQFLRGDLVTKNLMRRLRVIDLAQLDDRVLAEEALKLGLTRALREYPTFSNVTLGDLKRLRRRINRIGDRDLYELYQQQATTWHSTFRPPQP